MRQSCQSLRTSWLHVQVLACHLLFSKFHGFDLLQKQDQKRFLTEAQQRSFFPGDYLPEEGKKGIHPENYVSEEEILETAVKKRKANDSVTNDKSKKIKSSVVNVVIDGRNHSNVSVDPEQVVQLQREPNNVSIMFDQFANDCISMQN